MYGEKEKSKILVFAGGKKEPGKGGSGCEMMILNIRLGRLDAEIAAVVSNYPAGGVKTLADKYGIPFVYMPGPYTAEAYQAIFEKYPHDFIMLSGWLRPIRGNKTERTVNIHCGPLPFTRSLHGDQIHKKVWDAYQDGGITHSTVTMHFVPSFDLSGYDTGQIITQKDVPIRLSDTLETMKARVNAYEHAVQSDILNLVVHRQIYLHEGKVFYMDDFDKRKFFGGGA